MKELYNHVYHTFKKYIFTIISFMVAAIIMMITIYNSDDPANEHNMRLILTFIYGGIAATLITSISGHVNFKFRNWLYLLLPVIILVVYYVLLTDITVATGMLKYVVLCFLTIIAFFSIPFIKSEEDSDYYTYKVLLSLAITIVSYIVLLIGIIMIFKAVSVLFELELPEYLYPDIMTFIMGFIAPLAFLSLIGDNTKRGEYPVFVRVVLSYIVIPILDVYTVVLYAYFIKILIDWQIPSNMLGVLTIPYAIVSIIILYFMHGMKKGKVIDLYVKIYPYLLILPMIMMLTSLIIRINEYGVTEARYYAVLLFIFVMGSIFIIKKYKVVKYIPLFLAALLLMSIVDPISASSVSRCSREKRLESVLMANNMLKNNNVISNSTVSGQDKRVIIDTLEYFSDNQHLDDLEFLPNDFEMDDMEKVFGFKRPSIIIF